jgi:hypothetical protein
MSMLRIIISTIFALFSFGYLSAILTVLLRRDQKAPARIRRR